MNARRRLDEAKSVEGFSGWLKEAPCLFHVDWDTAQLAGQGEAQMTGIAGPARDRSGSDLGTAQKPCEQLHRKRLLCYFVGEFPVEPRMINIAGDEHRPDFRPLRARPFEKLDSRHPWH